MEFLKEAALPQSPGHFQLIIFIAAIATMALLPYIATVVGASVLSVIAALKGKEGKNPQMTRAARLVVDRTAGSMSTILFLGILPALSVLFVYAQILQTTNSISLGMAGFGFIFMAAGFILLHTYAYTLRLGGILNAYAQSMPEGRAPAVEKYRSEHNELNRRSGIYGTLFLAVAAFLYTAAFGLAVERTLWNEVQSLFGIFMSPAIWMRWLHFAVLSAGMTGMAMLYFSDSAKEPGDEALKWLKIPTRMVIVALLLMPVLMLLMILLKPLPALSGDVYLLTGVTGLLFFLASHFLYVYYSRKKPELLRFGFYAFLSAVITWIACDHITLSNATKQESALLAAAHENVKADLRSKLGISQAAVSGEDIFNAKCSACHLYDAKKVGPAYNDVIPKYGGDKAKLIAFVMNPQKIDPAYPPMPAQGLRTAEADSVVAYILSWIPAKTP